MYDCFSKERDTNHALPLLQKLIHQDQTKNKCYFVQTERDEREKLTAEEKKTENVKKKCHVDESTLISCIYGCTFEMPEK